MKQATRNLWKDHYRGLTTKGMVQELIRRFQDEGLTPEEAIYILEHYTKKQKT